MYKTLNLTCFALFLGALTCTPPTLAQEVSPWDLQWDTGWESRAAFLRDEGRLEDALRIREDMVERVKQERDSVSARYYKHLGVLAARVVIGGGYTYDLVSRLRQDGLDLVWLGLIYPNPLGPYTKAEWAALVDVVVTATVTDRFDSLLPRDGFRSSVVLEVHEVLRGSVDSKYIIIRRSSGKTSRGSYSHSGHERTFERGEAGIFYLSNGYYRYYSAYIGPGHDWRSQDLLYQAQDPDRHLRYYSFDFDLVSDNDWSPLEADIADIRRVGQLIRSHTQ